jgi:hypothetical protein
VRYDDIAKGYGAKYFGSLSKTLLLSIHLTGSLRSKVSRVAKGRNFLCVLCVQLLFFSVVKTTPLLFIVTLNLARKEAK